MVIGLTERTFGQVVGCLVCRFNCYSLTTAFIVVEGDLFQDFGVWSFAGPTRSCGGLKEIVHFMWSLVVGRCSKFLFFILISLPPHSVRQFTLSIVVCICISLTLGGLTCTAPLLNSIRFGWCLIKVAFTKRSSHLWTMAIQRFSGQRVTTTGGRNSKCIVSG